MNQVCNTVMIPVEEYEVLREKVSDLNKVIVHQDECYAGLERQLTAMTQELDELDHEFGAEHRLYLTCKQQLAAMTQERDELKVSVEYWASHAPTDAYVDQLTAAQARIKELREALERCEAMFDYHNIGTTIAQEALATPDDPSALDAALKAEREKAMVEAWGMGEVRLHEYLKGGMK